MRARGISYAVESMTNINFGIIEDSFADEVYTILDKVIQAKFSDFLPHYLVKILDSFYKVKKGSQELYSMTFRRLINEFKEMSY